MGRRSRSSRLSDTRTGDGLREVRSRTASRGSTALILALLLLGWLTGCDAGAVGDMQRTPSGDDASVASDRTEVRLKPVDGSDTGGTVSFVPSDGGTEVRLSLRRLPDPAAVYVGAIYRGRCSSDIGGSKWWHSLRDTHPGYVAYRFAHGGGHEPADEDVVQTLTSVTSDPTGEGTSVTPLPSAVEELLAGGPKYVDVHGEGGSVLACADLLSADSSSA